MQSVLKGAGKQAIKAAIVRGSKAVGVYGFVADAGIFLYEYQKEYKKAYINYRPKKKKEDRRWFY